MSLCGTICNPIVIPESGTPENPFLIPDNINEIPEAAQELALREGDTVINRPEHPITQHIPNPQYYNAYAQPDEYALLVIQLPRILLEPFLRLLNLFAMFYL